MDGKVMTDGEYEALRQTAWSWARTAQWWQRMALVSWFVTGAVLAWVVTR